MPNPPIPWRALITVLLWFPSVSFGQKTWVEPANYRFDDTVKLFVDLKHCRNADLLHEQQVYLHTWLPANPVIGNGEWTESNADMAMESEGNGVWSYTMVPAKFYDSDSAAFLKKGWRFLVKARDGSENSNGELKTENLALIMAEQNELEIPGAFERGVKFGQFHMKAIQNYRLWPDAEKKLSIEEIMAMDKSKLLIPYDIEDETYLQSAFWIIADVQNSLDRSYQFCFSVGIPVSSWNDIDVYLKDQSGKLQHYRVGFYTPRRDKPIDDWRNFFKTEIAAGKSTRLYIRVSDFASHELSPQGTILYQYDDVHLRESESKLLLKLVLMSSLLGFVVMYYLLWYIVSRKKELGFYSLLWLGFFVAVVIPAPIGYYFGINEVSVLIKDLYGLAMGWMIGFTLSFWGILGFTVHYFRLNESHPRMVRWAIYFAFVPLVLLLVGLVNYFLPSWFPRTGVFSAGFIYFPFTVIRSLLLALALIFSFGMGIHFYRKGFFPALFFLIAFLPLTISACLVSFSNVVMAFAGQPIGLPPLFDNINNVCMILALILFALAMGYRQKIHEKDSLRAQQALTDAREKEWMLKEKELALEVERASKDHLQELDALKSKYFANISHEFRTPLTLILAQNEQLRSSLANSGMDTEFLAVNRNGQRILDLINQLLDLSSLADGKLQLALEPVDLIPYTKNLLYSFESLAHQKNITLHFDSEAEELIVLIDSMRIERVIFNLLSNAIKFSMDGEIKIKVYNEGEMIGIDISDKGHGIAQEELPYIFDRYYRSEMATESPGTGIGLALVKELVQLHGGSIDVRSKSGVGSTFTIRLPFRKPEPSAIVDVFEPTLLPISEGDEIQDEHIAPIDADEILVVEDNVDVRKFLAKQLVLFGYRVLEAHDGAEGFEIARERLPDLIISDVVMPRMNGFEFAHAIRTDEHTSHIPLILLTAQTTEESKIKGLESGVDDYLTKPFNSKELQLRISNLIRLRKQLSTRFRKATNISPVEVSAVPMDQLFIEKVLAAIDQRLSDTNLSLDLLSHEVGMSVTNLNRKLNALVGQSAGKLIRVRRLHRAAELLRLRAGTVSEIAFDTGFSDPSNFTRAFKKHYGISPSDYH